MRVVRENRIFTKVLVYALINTFTLAYMPIADLSVAHAKRRDSASVYMFGFAMDGDKTPLELKGMAEEHFKEEFKDEKRIKFITPKNARERLKGGKAGQPTKGLEGKKKYYSRAKRYLKIAKEGVEEKEFEDAMDAALKAVKYFKKSANHVKDFSLVKEAYEQAAGASEAADENGSEFMQTVLAFERDYRPSGALKSGLKKAYEKASRLPKKSRLEITVEPENAKILVNNREDTSPYKGRKLIAGDYFIRIEADGYKPYTNVVTLPGGGRESLEVVLAPEQEGGSGDDKMGAFKTVNLKARDQEFDREFFEKAQRVGQWIGAEFLVFGAFKTKGEKSTFHPLVFDVEEGRMGHIPRPHGQGQSPELFAAQLEPGPGRPDPVAHRDLDPVFLAEPGHLVAAGEEVGPVVDIFLGVGQDLALARGSGGGVDPDHLFQGNREQGEGIAPPKIVGLGKGQLPDVVQALDGIRTNPGLIQPFPVELRALAGVSQGPFEAFQLMSLEFVQGGEGGHESLWWGHETAPLTKG